MKGYEVNFKGSYSEGNIGSVYQSANFSGGLYNEMVSRKESHIGNYESMSSSESFSYPTLEVKTLFKI